MMIEVPEEEKEKGEKEGSIALQLDPMSSGKKEKSRHNKFNLQITIPESYCFKHPSEIVTYYCKKCKKFACIICVTKHNDHLKLAVSHIKFSKGEYAKFNYYTDLLKIIYESITERISINESIPTQYVIYKTKAHTLKCKICDLIHLYLSKFINSIPNIWENKLIGNQDFISISDLKNLVHKKIETIKVIILKILEENLPLLTTPSNRSSTIYENPDIVEKKKNRIGIIYSIHMIIIYDIDQNVSKFFFCRQNKLKEFCRLINTEYGFFAFGGIEKMQSLSNSYFVNEDKKILDNLTDMLYPCHDMGIASAKDSIYVIGGSITSITTITSNKVLLYKITSNTWMKSAKLLTPKSRSCCVIFHDGAEDKLFSFGGFFNGDPVSYIDKYTIRKDKWKRYMIKAAPLGIIFVSQVSSNNILIIGGKTDDKDLYEFNKLTKKIESKGQLDKKFQQQFFDSKFYEDKLYMLGNDLQIIICEHPFKEEMTWNSTNIEYFPS